MDTATSIGGKKNKHAGAKKYGSHNRRKDKIFIVSMLALPLLQFLIFFVYINIRTVTMTFESINWTTGTIQYGFQNYLRLFTEFKMNDMLKFAIVNSFIIFLATVFIILPISVLFGYFIFKGVPAKRVFRVIFFFPSIISVVVLTMVFKFMFNPLFGPVNAILAQLGIPASSIPAWLGSEKTVMPMIVLYNVWAGIGFNMLFLNGAISGLPKDVFDYSKLEGVGMARELCQIIVPMIWPTVVSLFVMGATSMFTFFLPAKLLTGGGPNGASMTIAMYITDLISGV